MRIRSFRRKTRTVLRKYDSYLNDARQARLGREHLDAAFGAAASDFGEGAVGAGCGMSCFNLKGGIGSASRVVETCGREFTLGALVNANFGRMEDLILAGRPIGSALRALTSAESNREGDYSDGRRRVGKECRSRWSPYH